MSDSLLAEGFELMLTGMGTVFVFLTVLVIALSLMSRLLGREPLPSTTEPDAETVAAITAAIEQHRHRNSR